MRWVHTLTCPIYRPPTFAFAGVSLRRGVQIYSFNSHNALYASNTLTLRVI
jgi:hypothetical protein